jgi:DNA/RNA-binding domain of Phe-tRNA-synthetase-like protein
MNITISNEIIEKCPNIRLGLLSADVSIHIEHEELWYKILTESKIISDNQPDLLSYDCIQSARAAYKALGKDPSRYRPSAEALLRRIISGKELYSVNNVVNLINFISFKSGFSIGGYDSNAIKGKISLTKGLQDDHYEGLGRGVLNIENLPVLRDEIGAFGCPTSDSERTGIRSETKHCLWVFFDFGSSPMLEKNLIESGKLLQEFADAKNIATQIFRNS